jgi:ubiquinone/menaquinone biosynthesis C-methylase UbiE
VRSKELPGVFGDMNEELRARAAQYDAMAKMHAQVTFDDRRAFDTACVRHLNNFVKSCIIDTTCQALAKRRKTEVAGIRVADVACGRGQDQSKWMYGARGSRMTVDAYYGLDLSSADTDLARSMAQKYIAPTATVVDIRTADMGKQAWHIPTAGVDVVTCQLALHYLFDKDVHLFHFFTETARVLDVGGLILVSFTDGRSVVRRARDSTHGHFISRYYTLDVPPAVSALRLESPFGNQYTFTMPGSVENVPEYLCHEGVITGAAQKHGFLVATSLYFDELAVALNRDPYFYDIAEKMGGNGIRDPDALDAANLYRIMVLARSQEHAAQFNACLKRPPRPQRCATPSTSLTSYPPSRYSWPAPVTAALAPSHPPHCPAI